MQTMFHPTQDRTQLTRTLRIAMFLLCLGAVALWSSSFAEENRDLAASVMIVSFVVGIGYEMIFGPRMNSCSCPNCGRMLLRSPDTTEFVCEPCLMTWKTRCFGVDLYDHFR
jgi:hypothetical protein